MWMNILLLPAKLKDTVTPKQANNFIYSTSARKNVMWYDIEMREQNEDLCKTMKNFVYFSGINMEKQHPRMVLDIYMSASHPLY